MRRKLGDWLFNGYVKQALPIAIICLLLEIVLLVFAVISTWEYLQMLDSSMHTETMECIITGYEHEKGSPVYTLETDCNITVAVPVNAVQDLQVIGLLIEEQHVVSIEYDCKTGRESRRVDALTIVNVEGTPIVAANEVLSARQENSRKAQIILWSVCLCYGVMIGGAYYILCNAPKYPMLAAFLIRKPYRNF